MDCNGCGEELTAFLDGELSSADSDRVRSHLRTCVACSEELRSLRELGDFIESHNRSLEPRPESWNMVRARIYQAQPEPSPRLWIMNRWRLAMAALGLLVAFTFGYMQYQHIQERDLDNYISRYERERKAIFSVPANKVESYNPFIEIKATVDDNPFRSEGR